MIPTTLLHYDGDQSVPAAVIELGTLSNPVAESILDGTNVRVTSGSSPSVSAAKSALVNAPKKSKVAPVGYVMVRS